MPSAVRSILVALDGSSEAEAAVDLSLRWAADVGARVVGLGIVDDSVDRVLADKRCRVKDLLAELSRRCVQLRLPCDVLEENGVPSERILLAAQEHDLVVLPRSGHFRDEPNGGRDDTVERVLRKSARPVVTVTPGPPRPGPVVVAYDGGTHAARALHAFRIAAVESGVELLVVSVHASEATAARFGVRAMDYLGSHAVRARLLIIPSVEPPDEAIARVVRDVDARLLVAGVRTSHLLAERLFGSVTRALRETCDVPMFLSG